MLRHIKTKSASLVTEYMTFYGHLDKVFSFEFSLNLMKNLIVDFSLFGLCSRIVSTPYDKLLDEGVFSYVQCRRTWNMTSNT